MLQVPDFDGAVPGGGVEEGAVRGEGERADGVGMLHPGPLLAMTPRLHVAVVQSPVVEELAEAGEGGYLLELSTVCGWAPKADFEVLVGGAYQFGAGHCNGRRWRGGEGRRRDGG
ncbi:hypothetical protein GOP47_0025062 [Adiantum capillus-veneris]|uniref:Uncharacterized protein n=1 Tax=Adiantum capillus-veneris TaxID=13818 RepID=A0A9D4U3Z3_ADICA|nr:hypothetical protein GOP47_0025062 [Adiantum capillus-veneris]